MKLEVQVSLVSKSDEETDVNRRMFNDRACVHYWPI